MLNTIQPELLGEEVKKMQMESALFSWMMDNPTSRIRPEQYKGPTRDCHVPFPCSTAWLTPKLTQAAVFFRNVLIIQLLWDAFRDVQYEQHTIEEYLDWCACSHLRLNISKTKEKEEGRPEADPVTEASELELATLPVPGDTDE